MATTTVTGEIEAINDKGLRIRGDWFNYSKYPGKQYEDLPQHDRGDVVVLKIANDKWIDGLRLDPFAMDGQELQPVVSHHGRVKEVSYVPAQNAFGNDTTRQPAAPVQDFCDVQRRLVPRGTTVAQERSDLRGCMTKDESIVRQTCIKAAAEAYQPTGGEEPFEVACSVIVIATQLEAWVQGRINSA